MLRPTSEMKTLSSSCLSTSENTSSSLTQSPITSTSSLKVCSLLFSFSFSPFSAFCSYFLGGDSHRSSLPWIAFLVDRFAIWRMVFVGVIFLSKSAKEVVKDAVKDLKNSRALNTTDGHGGGKRKNSEAAPSVKKSRMLDFETTFASKS